MFIGQPVSDLVLVCLVCQPAIVETRVHSEFDCLRDAQGSLQE